jgi:TPR repeat protein
MAREAEHVQSFALLIHAVLEHYCKAHYLLARLIGVKVPVTRLGTWPSAFAHEANLARDARSALMCCGGTATLALRLVHGLQGKQAYFFSIGIVRRVAAARAAAAREKLFRKGLDLHSTCDFAAAAELFGLACRLGHNRAHAELSWMLAFGREGVAKDRMRSFQLADTGARAGCAQGKGALAYCALYGQGCREDAALALRLAGESAAAGCSYGQFMLGKMHRNCSAGLKLDLVASAACYHAAASQGLAEAQFCLGLMHQQGLMHEPGFRSARRYDEALRWYNMAAAQGQPSALHAIGCLYEGGWGVSASTAEAVEWFLRAHAAGDAAARGALQRYRSVLPASVSSALGGWL